MVHGCIHSNPCLLEVPAGKVEVIRGRLYLFRGTPEDFWNEYQRAHQEKESF